MPEQVDPMKAWRDWFGQTERQMNDSMNLWMGKPEFVESSAKMLEVFSLYQSTFQDAAEKYLGFANMPSRRDVSSLAARLTSIEQRLSSLEGQLTASNAADPLPDAESSPAKKRPARTRKAKANGPESPSSSSTAS